MLRLSLDCSVYTAETQVVISSPQFNQKQKHQWFSQYTNECPKHTQTKRSGQDNSKLNIYL